MHVLHAAVRSIQFVSVVEGVVVESRFMLRIVL